MQKLSRSKIELFFDCPRCMWLEVKGGVKRPPPAPYTINSAIDWLFKQEFDVHREKGTPHPIMEAHGLLAVPFEHAEMNKWRHNFTGVQYEDKENDFLVYGAVDDVWVNQKGELMVVDYKATGAKEHHIYDSYGRQMEVYQWLLRRKGFTVSSTGYFVFARVNKSNGFGNGNAVLGFDIFLEPYEGNSEWIEGTLKKIRATLNSETPPEKGNECEYCEYRESAHKMLHAR